MKTYARIQDGVVAEILSLPDDVKVEDLFHPDIAANIVSCSSKIVEGQLYENGKFKDAPEKETETVIPGDREILLLIATIILAFSKLIPGVDTREFEEKLKLYKGG